MNCREALEAELDRLARHRENPDAFEALFWVLYQLKRDGAG